MGERTVTAIDFDHHMGRRGKGHGVTDASSDFFGAAVLLAIT